MHLSVEPMRKWNVLPVIGLLKIQQIPITKISLTRERSILQQSDICND